MPNSNAMGYIKAFTKHKTCCQSQNKLVLTATALSICLIFVNEGIIHNPYSFGLISLIVSVSDHFLVHQEWSLTRELTVFRELYVSFSLQDLLLPYFCITTDITSSRMRVHTDGESYFLSNFSLSNTALHQLL